MGSLNHFEYVCKNNMRKPNHTWTNFFDPLSKMKNVLKRNTVSENVIPQAQGPIKRKPPP